MKYSLYCSSRLVKSKSKVSKPYITKYNMRNIHFSHPTRNSRSYNSTRYPTVWSCKNENSS